MVNTIYHMDF